jgi:hypothetical protein
MTDHRGCVRAALLMLLFTAVCLALLGPDVVRAPVASAQKTPRAGGVETGEYHFAERIKPDVYDRLKALPDLVTGPIKPAI